MSWDKMNRGRALQVIGLGIVMVLDLGTQMTYGLSDITPDTGIKLKIEKEWKSNHCSYTKATRSVIYTEKEWKDTWEKINVLRLPRPELPKIDFGKEMVITVFMGERPSGGYSIEIINILKTEKEIVVVVEEKEPLPESLKTMALTSPYHIVMVKRSILPVRFQSP